MKLVKVNDLIGKVIQTMAVYSDYKGRSVLVIYTTDSHQYAMFHSNCCCSQVQIFQVSGNPQNLVKNYAPIISFEHKMVKVGEHDSDHFYTLSTEYGECLLQWKGCFAAWKGSEVNLGKLENSEKSIMLQVNLYCQLNEKVH